MAIAFTKLPGLDPSRILAIVEPVLSAHRVDGVELIWRTDRGGMVLELTIEMPGSKVPGAGITVDLCSEISRDLSAALDVADVISPRYNLEVGSPGVERALYSLEDARRFAGQLCKIKLKEPLAFEGSLKEQRVLRGTLFGVDEEERIQLDTDQGSVLIAWSNVSTARLVFDWNRAMQASGRGPRPTGSGQKNRTNKRSME